jgi:putative ABC transport system substrate-binding protein
MIFPDALFVNNASYLVELTTKLRMPAMHNIREFAVAGGLLSYGTDQLEACRQAGAYAGRILAGEKPPDLPVVQSTRFNFVVAITLPPTLLGTADELIE